VIEERTPEQRYRVYSVDPGKVAKQSLRLLATAPDPAGFGVAIATLRVEGDITDNTRVGVLDGIRREWVVNPWARGEP
jgi:hypothetical protein